MLDAITQFERSANFAFAGFILHDAEDVISPMELHLFNYLVERKNLIQIPCIRSNANGRTSPA